MDSLEGTILSLCRGGEGGRQEREGDSSLFSFLYQLYSYFDSFQQRFYFWPDNKAYLPLQVLSWLPLQIISLVLIVGSAIANNDSQLVYKLLCTSVAWLNEITILKIKYQDILHHIVRSVTTFSKQKKYLDLCKFGIFLLRLGQAQDLRVGRARVTPTSDEETSDHRVPVMLERTSRTRSISASRVTPPE